MKNKRAIFAILFIALAMTACVFSEKKHNSKLKQSRTFFAAVPITKFSSIQVPCVDVMIENKTFSMELDLGLRGDLSLSNAYIDEILSKNLIGTKSMYGFRGKEYRTTLYEIPEIRIGPLSLFKPILQENSEEARKEALIVQEDKLPSPREPGRLGWMLFYNFNLFVDVKHSQIGFCDSIETLKKRGYPTENLVSVPLREERGLIEFEAMTPDGPLLCMLDTGSTWNILNNIECKEGESVDQIALDLQNIVECSQFSISGIEFGSIRFRRIPIRMPIHIEAVLGMEFFEDHFVFIDFAKKQIYFERAAGRNLGPSTLSQASYLSVCGKELAARYWSGESPSFQEGVLQRGSPH